MFRDLHSTEHPCWIHMQDKPRILPNLEQIIFLITRMTCSKKAGAKSQPGLELRGIDPRTSSMLKKRSTM